MKYKTKQQRLIAISETYCKSPFTINELATWALANSLYPVPKSGDPEAICSAWEHRLETASQEQLT